MRPAYFLCFAVFNGGLHCCAGVRFVSFLRRKEVAHCHLYMTVRDSMVIYYFFMVLVTLKEWQVQVGRRARRWGLSPLP